MSVSNIGNPSRQGGSPSSNDCSIRETVGTTSSIATTCNHRTSSHNIVAITIRLGGGIQERPAKHEAKIGGGNISDHADASHAHGKSADSHAPNPARRGGSGREWPICTGPHRAEGEQSGRSTERFDVRERSVSHRGTFARGGQRVDIQASVIRADVSKEIDVVVRQVRTRVWAATRS